MVANWVGDAVAIVDRSPPHFMQCYLCVTDRSHFDVFHGRAFKAFSFHDANQFDIFRVDWLGDHVRPLLRQAWQVQRE